MAAVSLRNLSKSYPAKAGEVVAVDNLNLDLADREFVVLLGSRGSGKSTVLRMIAGLEDISKGEIAIGAQPMNDIGPKDREVAMVFQADALYPHLSGRENLAFGLKLRKFSATEIKRRVTEAASLLGIEALLDRRPRLLSDAERARLGIARAIVRQPKVLLLDEPLVDLDAAMRTELRAEITRLHHRLQATTIYATRDPMEAMALGDRIVVMNVGVVQQDDSASKIYNQPANLFVAGFVGRPPMNFVSGTLKTEGEKIRFRERESGTIEVSFAAADRSAMRTFAGNEVILGIRPEDLAVTSLTRSESKGVPDVFPAIVDRAEPRGAETHLWLQTGAHTLICRSRAGLERSEAGHRVQVKMDLGKAHFFNPGSGERLRDAAE